MKRSGKCSYLKHELTFLFSDRKNHIFQKQSRIQFCNTYIIPHIDYCTDLCGKCPESQKDILDRQCKNMSAPSAQMFAGLNWLKTECRSHYQTIALTYKAIHGQAPSYLKDCLIPSNIDSLRSHSRCNLQLPHFRKEICRDSFSYSAAVFWNALTGDTKCSQTLSSFKSKNFNLYLHLNS